MDRFFKTSSGAVMVACIAPMLASCTHIFGLDTPVHAEADGGSFDAGTDGSDEPNTDAGPEVRKGCECPGFRAVPKAPLERLDRTAFAFGWTGHEYLVWGGEAGSLTTLGDGAAFDPVHNTWRVLPPAPLSARSHAAAIWLGRQWLIWGGTGESLDDLQDGALYDPATNLWSKLADGGPLSPRADAYTARIGNRGLIWAAAADAFGGPPMDGALFNSANRTWAAIAATPLSERAPFAALAGTTLVVRGGKGGDPIDGSGYVEDGAEYNISTNIWNAAHPLAPVLKAQKELVAATCGAAMDTAFFVGRTPAPSGGAIGAIVDSTGAETTLPAPATALSPPNATYTHVFCIKGNLGLFGTTKDGQPTGVQFDTVTKTWSALPSGGPEAFRSQSQVGGDEVFFWGGSKIVGDTPASHIYQP